MDHDSLYRYAGEWIDIVKLLWTREEEFDFEGEFFNIAKGQSSPKPLRKPHTTYAMFEKQDEQTKLMEAQ